MWGGCAVVGRGSTVRHLGQLDGAPAGASRSCGACSPRPIGTTEPNAGWSTLSCMKGSPCQSGRPTPNERMQLTKREVLQVGAPSRAIFIESRFAADPRCYADRGHRAHLCE